MILYVFLFDKSFPGRRINTQTYIKTKIRLNTILTLPIKNLIIINKYNLYINLKFF